MNRILFACVVLCGGCATSATARPAHPDGVPSATRGGDADAASLRAALDEQRQRNRELSAQLGLAQATARELQEALEREPESRQRTTRIRHAQEDEPEIVADAEPPPAGDGRPVLRLYGPPPAPPRPAASTTGVSAIPGPAAPTLLAPPPVGMARLPVDGGDDPEAGVPAIPAAPLPISPAPIASAPDEGAHLYRAALAHLAARRLGPALDGIEEFLTRHPRHPYADNAWYWRGEIHYARREYARALSAFSGLVSRYPRGNKVPDALLRIGRCYERLGEDARAERVFARLRAEYPDTVAARTVGSPGGG